MRSSCDICKKYLAGNPDNIINYADNPELLRRHFLKVRKKEASDIEDIEKSEIVKQLYSTYNRYDQSFRDLPNPDAFVSGTMMQGLEYLKSWAMGIEG